VHCGSFGLGWARAGLGARAASRPTAAAAQHVNSSGAGRIISGLVGGKDIRGGAPYRFYTDEPPPAMLTPPPAASRCCFEFSCLPSPPQGDEGPQYRPRPRPRFVLPLSPRRGIISPPAGFAHRGRRGPPENPMHRLALSCLLALAAAGAAGAQ